MESMLNDIVAIGVEEGPAEEGPVLFQMTAKVMVQALHKGSACNGKAYKESNLILIYVMARRVMIMHHRKMHLGNMHQWARNGRLMHLMSRHVIVMHVLVMHER
jgi:hypothetical protein